MRAYNFNNISNLLIDIRISELLSLQHANGKERHTIII